MEEIREINTNNRKNYQYNKLQHSFEMKNPALPKSNTYPKFGASLERNSNVKQNIFPDNGGILGRTCKVSLVSLKRVGKFIYAYLLNSPPSGRSGVYSEYS